jgi:hypothetical protein
MWALIRAFADDVLREQGTAGDLLKYAPAGTNGSVKRCGIAGLKYLDAGESDRLCSEGVKAGQSDDG